MNDFHEAVLSIEVPGNLGSVYKKAIEYENGIQWKQNPIYSSKKGLISNELKPVWNGNYAYVSVMGADETAVLTISLISHTLSNLKEQVEWYKKTGCKIVTTNYKEGVQ